MTVHHSQKDINKKTSTFLRLYDAKLAEISCDCYGYCNLYIITSTYIKKKLSTWRLNSFKLIYQNDQNTPKCNKYSFVHKKWTNWDTKKYEYTILTEKYTLYNMLMSLRSPKVILRSLKVICLMAYKICLKH